MKNLILIAIIAITTILTSCGFIFEDKSKLNYSFVNVNEVQEKIDIIIEETYFEAQKDVLEDSVCIEQLPDGRWIWKKSPWNSGKKPKWNPSTVIDPVVE